MCANYLSVQIVQMMLLNMRQGWGSVNENQEYNDLNLWPFMREINGDTGVGGLPEKWDSKAKNLCSFNVYWVSYDFEYVFEHHMDTAMSI